MQKIRALGLAALVAAASGCNLFEDPELGLLTVVVLDAQRHPIPGISVIVQEVGAGPRGEVIGSGVTGQDGSITLGLGFDQYDITIGTLPEGVIMRELTKTELVAPGEETIVRFVGLGDAGFLAHATWYVSVLHQGPIEDALVEVVRDGEVVASARTDDDGWATIPPLTRRVYDVRFTGPEWVDFGPPRHIDLVAWAGDGNFRVSVQGEYVGERTVEARVTVDGEPLEGVEVSFEHIFVDDDPVALTDAEGKARWVGAPEGTVGVTLSAYDEQAFRFAPPYRRVQVDVPPGTYVAVFEGERVVAGDNQPPTATITSPPSGITVPQWIGVQLVGLGTDPEDGALGDASLAWSSDLDGDLGTGGIVDTSLSLGTHVLTLAATDSQGAVGTASVTLDVVENAAPGVTILSPADGTAFSTGQEAVFTGGGADPEDGVLTGASLVWTSSLDGQIGTGESISVTTLQVGTHTITLTGTDGQGATGTDEIEVTVAAAGNGTIQGRVEVPGAGLAGVTVTATGPTTATTVTDAFGDYTLGGLPAGTYTVTISSWPPWATFTEPSQQVTVGAGGTVTVTFTGTGG